MNNKFFAIADLLLILGLLGTAPLIYVLLKHPGGDVSRVEIFMKNKIAAVYPLQPAREIRLNGASGPIVLEIKNRSVRVKETHCPRRLCQKQSWISRSGESIVCVPGEVVISINGDSNLESVDGVTR